MEIKATLALGVTLQGRRHPPMLHTPTNDRVTEWLWVQMAHCFPGCMTAGKLFDLFKAHLPHLLKEVLGIIF